MRPDVVETPDAEVLITGRVRMKYVRTTPDLALVNVVAQVLSSRDGGPRYAVDFDNGRWSCTCGVEVCKHQAAVQLVTIGRAKSPPQGAAGDGDLSAVR